MSATRPTLAILHAASSRFEAARQVEMLPAGHRCRRMHGHGFTATAYAAVPTEWVAYPGGEVAALQQQINRCAEILTYGVLNEHLAQPTDENLARWIRARLDTPGIDRVAVQSTPNPGGGGRCEGSCSRLAALPLPGRAPVAVRAART